ncbi:MAG: hypothetical protein HC927_00130 [Deltaproteobacteria bacterium]|nr:hypothetical protein [Deltaproteobacteria bacterium]
MNNVDPPDIPKREPSTDEVVQTFIDEQLRENPKLGWTPLLRRWRSNGRACEQSRFRDLYREVKERMSSTTRDQ